MKGCKRFVDRAFALTDILAGGDSYSPELEASFHKTIKKVTEDIESLKFNTAIAAMMALINEIYDCKKITRGELRTFLILLNPFAPHLTEELWENLKFGGMIANTSWPKYDEEKCKDDTVEIVVQINGKIKAKLNISADIDKDSAIAAAKAEGDIASAIAGKTIVKEIYVPQKLVNIVVK